MAVSLNSEPTAGDVVSLSIEGGVARIALDDGKANALSPAVVADLHAAVARARDEAGAIVLTGREGRFCAGFDLRTMQAGPAESWALVEAGARVAIDLYLSPVPVVVACTGHAMAMGAILLMSGDARVGAEGPYKIGLNEVAIGMPMPRFAAELARDRLAPTHLTGAVQLARIHDPAGAVAAGFLDELAPPGDVVARAVELAGELADRLDPAAFRITRAVMRAEHGARLSASLDHDRSAGSATPRPA